MRKTEKEKYRKALLAKKKELLEELAHTMKSSVSTTIRESTGDISSYSYHMADQGTDEYQYEATIQFASTEGRYLYHIEEALNRIEDGSYGKCDECGGKISMERLRALPHARLCIECKEKEEAGNL